MTDTYALIAITFICGVIVGCSGGMIAMLRFGPQPPRSDWLSDVAEAGRHAAQHGWKPRKTAP